MEWSAQLAALDLHADLDTTLPTNRVLALFAQALQDAYRRGRSDEREQIARAIEAEADATPDAEDARVTRDLALLVRADFSYEDAERLEAEAQVAEHPAKARP